MNKKTDGRNDSLMLKETFEAPNVVAQQIKLNQDPIKHLVERFKNNPPKAITTCARGSSDHASVYGKYLCQILLGIPVLSLAPSVGSLYDKQMDLTDTLFFAVSQSGKSPDLIVNAELAKKSGAYIVAVVNDIASPLAELADLVIPLHAGPEISVAATKSYIASLSVFAQLIAIWSGDKQLLNGLQQLPDALHQSLTQNWDNAIEMLTSANNMMVIGRGVGYGVTRETALKFKETSILHAEAFSTAEIMHGPMALLKNNFPMIAYVQDDVTKASNLDIIDKLRNMGGRILVAQSGTISGKYEQDHLPIYGDIHPLLQPITMIQSFYKMANSLAFERGLNPDKPDHLNKVTKTR